MQLYSYNVAIAIFSNLIFLALVAVAISKYCIVSGGQYAGSIYLHKSKHVAKL